MSAHGVRLGGCLAVWASLVVASRADEIAQPWGTVHGNMFGTQSSEDPRLMFQRAEWERGAEVAWTLELHALGLDRPNIRGGLSFDEQGNLYWKTASYGGQSRVVSVSANGTLRWVAHDALGYAHGLGTQDGTTVVVGDGWPGGRVYAIGTNPSTSDSVAVAYEKETGTLVWQAPLPGANLSVASSRLTPVLFGGKLYVAGAPQSGSATFYQIDSATGLIDWSSAVSGISGTMLTEQMALVPGAFGPGQHGLYFGADSGSGSDGLGEVYAIHLDTVLGSAMLAWSGDGGKSARSRIMYSTITGLLYTPTGVEYGSSLYAWAPAGGLAWAYLNLPGDGHRYYDAGGLGFDGNDIFAGGLEGRIIRYVDCTWGGCLADALVLGGPEITWYGEPRVYGGLYLDESGHSILIGGTNSRSDLGSNHEARVIAVDASNPTGGPFLEFNTGVVANNGPTVPGGPLLGPGNSGSGQPQHIYYFEATTGNLVALKPAVGEDCNGNGINDGTDIAHGTSQDINGSGIPDECEVRRDGDYDQDCDTDVGDFARFQDCFDPGVVASWECLPGDFSADGVVSLADFSAFAGALEAGPGVGCAMDYWATNTNGLPSATYLDCAGDPVPTDFFGPGSDPFDGQVSLWGQNWDPYETGDADTFVRRVGEPVLPGDSIGATGTVPIEIVGLSLVSISPITVTYNGGLSPEQWHVMMGLSLTAPPMGSLTATKTHANGGTFTEEFYIQPLLIFAKVSDPSQVRVFDSAGSWAPIHYVSVTGYFVHSVDPALEVVPSLNSQLALGVEEVVPGNISSQTTRVLDCASSNGLISYPLARKPKVCLYEVTCEDGSCRGCPLREGDICQDAACPNNTCVVSFSRTCGDPLCKLDYTWRACRPQNGEPPCPPGDGCVCDPQDGACCGAGGSCTVMNEADCVDGGGTYAGDGVDCEPMGACCAPDTSCYETTSECCAAMGRYYHGDGTVCGPRAACCSGMDCVVRHQICCDELGGRFMADAGDCGPPNPCWYGACCHGDATCTQELEVECSGSPATFKGAGTDCADYLPTITQQPKKKAVCEGQNATFTIAATGTGTLHYQWKKNGSNVGSDSPTLTLSNVQVADSGAQITCEVRDDCGKKTSDEAKLTVVRIQQNGGDTDTLWWFDGANAANYSEQVTLTAVGGSTGTFRWTVTAGQDKVNLENGADDFTGNDNTVEVISTAASAAAATVTNDVAIELRIDGDLTCTFWTVVYAPTRLLHLNDQDLVEPTYGYETYIHYRIEDQFNVVLPLLVEINEQFTGAPVADFPGTDWRRGPEGSATLSPADWNDWVQGEWAGATPVPVAPGDPNAGVAVQHWPGEWRIGSLTIGDGRRVASAQWAGSPTCVWQKYRGHARHE